jgi:EAL domain-containing protein (putative c-di-GMP-specific phosphodiesterase class I)
VVIEAVRRAGAWRHEFPNRPITVTVNLFDDHLERRDLPTRVEYLMEDDEVSTPGGLGFEVGERHVLSGRRRTRDRLTVLRNSGVTIVVDDLGAAAAATDVAPEALRDGAVELFAALRAFPLDVVKLDPHFVRRLESDAHLQAVVDAAHASDIAVVALAVENEEMATRAQRVGFDLAQGFHFARPERPIRIDELLAAG